MTNDKVIEMDEPEQEMESSLIEAKKLSDYGHIIRKYKREYYNQLINEENYSTFLHYASEIGSLKLLKSLIAKDCPSECTFRIKLKTKIMTEAINLPNINGETALHIAAKKLNPAIIKFLLDSKANPDLRDDDGNTPLHYLANKILCDDYSREKLSDSLNILIEHPDVDLNPINSNRETPLKLAFNIINNTNVNMTDFAEEFFQTLINKGSITHDMPENFSVIFAETIKNASTSSLKTKSPTKVIETKLYNWIAGKEIKKIRTLWEDPSRMTPKTKNEIKRLINGRFGSKSILARVVSDSDEDGVSILLNELDANLFVKDVDGEIPLNASLSLKQSAISDLLVAKMKEKQGGSLDLDVVRESSDKVKSYLIANGAYIGNKEDEIKDFLCANILRDAFDQSINSCDHIFKESSDPNSPDHRVNLTYDFLFPNCGSNLEESIKAIRLLLSISRKPDLKEAFKHPLIETYIWYKFSFIDLQFLIYILIYILNIILIMVFKSTNKLNSYWTILNLLIFTSCVLLNECLSMIFLRMEYLKIFDKWIKWLMMLAIFWLSFYINVPQDDLQTDEWFNHILGWIVLISSYLIFLEMHKFVYFARYVAIVKRITRNYIKALLPLAVLYPAFNFCFAVILQMHPENKEEEQKMNSTTNITSFDTFALLFFQSIPRTLVMSTGEFDYSSYSKATVESPWYIQLSCSLILVFFLFFIFMVLTNVFTAIAVGDVEAVKQEMSITLLRSMLVDIYDVLTLSVVYSKLLPRLAGPLQNQKFMAEINKLSPSDEFIYRNENHFYEFRTCSIEVETRAAMRAIYRRRIGADKLISVYPQPNDSRDGSMKLMLNKIGKMERILETRPEENQVNLASYLKEMTQNQEILESKLIELTKNQEKLEYKLEENQRKLEFHLEKLMENLCK